MKIFLHALCYSLLVVNSDAIKAQSSSLTSSSTSPRQYLATYTSSKIFIDGNSDPVWDSAQWTETFVDISTATPPKYPTRVKMLWDSTYLYFFATMEEAHIWGDITGRDEVIFHNNDFEVFIDPDGDTHHYMEIEINALNTVWDLLLTKPYRNQPYAIDGWDIKGLKTAIGIDGTLNQSDDVDRAWYAEMAIPWESLGELYRGAIPPVNQTWRVNFSRVHWDHELQNGTYQKQTDATGKPLPEYNWVWSPQGAINMHMPERWGLVTFVRNPEPPKGLAPDEQLKQALYDVYAKRKEWSSQNRPKFKAMTVAQVRITPKVEFHQSGWNLWVISPFTNKTLLITQDGQFITQD